MEYLERIFRKEMEKKNYFCAVYSCRIFMTNICGQDNHTKLLYCIFQMKFSHVFSCRIIEMNIALRFLTCIILPNICDVLTIAQNIS